jgi:hypothetical protein
VAVAAPLCGVGHVVLVNVGTEVRARDVPHREVVGQLVGERPQLVAVGVEGAIL